MAAYKIFFKKSAWKDFEKITKEDLERILTRIKILSQVPRSPGCEKLIGQARYRLRQGRYRIVYSIQDDDHTVWVVKVGHRKDVYH